MHCLPTPSSYPSVSHSLIFKYYNLPFNTVSKSKKNVYQKVKKKCHASISSRLSLWENELHISPVTSCYLSNNPPSTGSSLTEVFPYKIYNK